MTKSQFATIIVLILVVATALLFQNYKMHKEIEELDSQVSAISTVLDDTHDEAEQAHERADAAATKLGE